MPTLNLRLSHLILGQKGGLSRIQIIKLLEERPYNLNQLAKILKVNYRTTKYHMGILLKNELVSSSHTGGYGEVYFLTPEMEGNMALLDDLMEKLENSNKLMDFTSSSKFFETVLAQMDDAVIIIDKEFRIFFWNKSSEKLFGYKRNEVIGNTIQIFPEPETQKKVISKAQRGKKITSFETKLKHKSGKLIDVAITISKIKDETGKLIGFSILNRDITERKKAEENLRRLATVVSDSSDAITVHDLEGRITAWNKAAEKIYGYTEAEALKMNILQIVPENQAQEALDLVKQIEMGKTIKPIETKRITKDGRILNVWLTGTKLVDDEGNVVAVATTERNITEQRETEEELEKKIEQVEQLDKTVADKELIITEHEKEVDSLLGELGRPKKYKRKI